VEEDSFHSSCTVSSVWFHWQIKMVLVPQDAFFLNKCHM
jgi:hypothetical protein